MVMLSVGGEAVRLPVPSWGAARAAQRILSTAKKPQPTTADTFALVEAVIELFADALKPSRPDLDVATIRARLSLDEVERLGPTLIAFLSQLNTLPSLSDRRH